MEKQTREPSWSEDQLRERPERDHLMSLYLEYLEEGHFVTGQPFDEADRDGAVWYARCSCGATHWGTEAARDGEPINYPEMKWWQRDHRSENGLPWQEWMPSYRPMSRWEQAAATGAHLLYLPHDEIAEEQGKPAWLPICSCSGWGVRLIYRMR